MHSLAPFDSEELAVAGAKVAQANGTFDINDQHVYLFPPDHRYVELSMSDLIQFDDVHI